MLNKIVTLILTIIILLKICFWISTNSPISRLSIVVLIFLITILNLKNKYTWFAGLFIFSFSIMAILLNFNIYKSDSWNSNPFLFLQSIGNSLQIESNSLEAISLNLFPLILYVILFLLFQTPNFRKKYLETNM